MRFVGNMAESYAMQYKHRVFTHSETFRGRIVNYYDCFTSDEIPPAFGDELNKEKVAWLDKIFREQKDSEDDFV